ncbi:hypothetical protein [Neolewinella antarctica]|uniref:Uncharacterized protein n=1 Tax=Neolewinella antarctica TaxID=442734 RepID=A0ABX0XB97_9BACT|nr:hypothetical protein [Neolewinella antarctica]NJC26241.1 hypothetical protein [Neolewinella antarctica]
MLYRALVSLLFLSGWSVPTYAQNNVHPAESWTTHTCGEGKKDYSPGHTTGWGEAGTGYDLALVITDEAWYDPAPLGRDAKDWLKAAGVSYYSFWRPTTWPKNHLSALVGFRMLADRQYEACAYVNDAEGGFKFGGETVAAVGDTVYVSLRVLANVATYRISCQGKTQKIAFENFAAAGRHVAVGPWHGGSLPAPAPTSLRTSFRWVAATGEDR